ncbi:MerR family transcriptional regulator [Microbacterium bovistercoris]|uniref:MerR family transcriptional regulator n=1 Tax=Microbacterium bovistercoris TaxID=2293570 RepID=UPI001C6EC38C|nr:MerR family transcriptional regulator [Microbacterium bovistercoris]
MSYDAITIGELSARTGVSVRALRHYEQNGLIAAVRTTAGHRRFAPTAVEDVRRIRLFLDAGMPLAVVARVVECFVDDGVHLHACVADALREHLDVVQQRIDDLDDQRRTLNRLQELVAV